MNERIKALYKQATGKKSANDFDARVLEAERFAELIVEKCAQASEVYWNDAGLQRAFSPSEYIYTVLEVEE